MSENQIEEGQVATAEQGTTGSITLSAGRCGILGIKAGMTQVYDKKGNALAVTVIDLKPTKVTQVKTLENDGYIGIQVGILPKRESRALSAQKGHAKKVGGEIFYHYQEIRLPSDAKIDGITPGVLLDASFVKEGDFVDLTAISKGKGFQGVMKRHHFAGGPASHGASICHRMPGSIGNRTDPGKVVKGRKMAGQMGHERVTVPNVRVIRVDLENQLLLVNGSVPGPRSGIVTIRKTAKPRKSAAAKAE